MNAAVADITADVMSRIRSAGFSVPSLTGGGTSPFDDDSRLLDPALLFSSGRRVPQLPVALAESQLAPLTRLSDDAAGAEAIVYRTKIPGILAKKYHSGHTVQRAALDAAVHLRRALPGVQRRLLDAHTSWPMAVVTDPAATAVGVAMLEAPQSFSYTRRTSGVGLLELQLLAVTERKYAKVLGFDVPDTQARLRVARTLAELTELLEQHQIVHGDFSYRNILYSVDGSGVFLLDCDGVQIGATPAAAPRPGSPEWIDPDRPPTGPDQESQRWQLAAAVARILGRCRSHPTRPSWNLRLPTDLGPAATPLRGAINAGLGARGGRPTAREWHTLLAKLT